MVWPGHPQVDKLGERVFPFVALQLAGRGSPLRTGRGRHHAFDATPDGVAFVAHVDRSMRK
jgi:hypothetical protein